jgi:isoleucyl-tRNA synthetase
MTTTETKPADGGGAKQYKTTLNLPKTDFAMEAKLVTTEPARLAKWNEQNLYAKVQANRAGSPVWMLHDGPPFANADIHIGHVINKTLKDVFLRYKTMRGYATPYIPGWDCHGLPIEHKIAQDLGPKLREMSTVEVRKKCWDHAAKYAGLQSEQFQRVGILGDWANPYWTMAPKYEAGTLEVFAAFVKAGLVYKQLKPVHWSIANQTALADAELEYKDVEDRAIYVEFPASNPGAIKGRYGLKVNAPVHFLAWTTTPWTLPANLALCFGPDVEYSFVHFAQGEAEARHGKILVLASALIPAVLAKAGVTAHTVLATTTGRDLAESGLTYTHPFIDRTGKLLTADYVTTTDGTGIVHTAPGHGEDDYDTGRKNNLDVYCPVQADGRYDTTVPNWLQGIKVWDANALVIDRLREGGLLLKEEKYLHSYPHDWRSKTPIIFRATEQWFISVEKPFSLHGETPASLRQRGLAAVKDTVEFIPAWGQARIEGMLQNRPAWCISRQRAWGLPIPVFYNPSGEALLTPDSVLAVSRRFAEKGSDAWFNDSPRDLLGADFKLPPGFDLDTLRKERDIFDVWFESGSSWHSVLQNRGLKYPADLYLEGSDQHRGWFQLSLLPALGMTGQPPYKKVLTHGFAVKPDGTKVSKSDKEYVTAMQEINRHGADLLRLWTCSMDYQGDLPVSPKVLADFGDKYRKIRNTIRYLLSNLYDFNPSADAVAVPAASLDGWALNQLATLVKEVTAAYESFQTHKAFRLIFDFCSVDISSLYGNAMKDRLYCDPPSSTLRRRSQTVMHEIARTLTRLIAPMVVFTADEAWEHVPGATGSVHLTDWPTQPPEADSATVELYALLMKLRESGTLQLDGLKKSAGLNKGVEAEAVYVVSDPKLVATLASMNEDLADLVGCGYSSIVATAPAEAAPVEVATDTLKAGILVLDRRTVYPACARSWKRRPDVGSDPAYPDLCARDAAAIRSIGGNS